MALPPPKCGELGAFYPVFERSELSAAERHTTVSGGTVGNTPSHALDAWYDSLPWGQCPSEEACAGKPQAGFCEGEAHNGAGSNTVTLSIPKGESNGEHKADLHTGGVLSTRPPVLVASAIAATRHARPRPRSSWAGIGQ